MKQYASECLTFSTGVIMAFIEPFLSGDTPNHLKLKNHLKPGLEKIGCFGEKISLAKVFSTYSCVLFIELLSR
jgi:hypothetical protein